MSYLYDLDSRFYPSLLAAGKLDIRDRSPAPTGGVIPADPTNRTILIGIGGMGVETIDRIKEAVSTRLAPGWENYIAFLAIDTDYHELEDATHLTGDECVRATKPGIQTTVAMGRNAYPRAWLPFVDEEEARWMTGFDGNGAGRKRLMGKMKLHYKLSGSRGVDEEIVTKLAVMKHNALQSLPVNSNGLYEVYVIGSVSGGTCSGCFLEMPALIRRALNDDARTRIHAMLYLPDTLTTLDPFHAGELMANGYAALKELDYYQGLRMREGTGETFYCNDPAARELTLSSKDGFFTIPYLIGTRSGATERSKQEAMEAVVGFFAGALGTMTAPVDNVPILDSFRHFAMARMPARIFAEGNDHLEPIGHDHSRPNCYGTMGFARACVPAQIVNACVISRVCKAAGLEPIRSDERAARIAAGEVLLPFLGEDQYPTAKKLNADAQMLLEPLLQYIHSFHAPIFRYADVFGADPTWDDIRDGSADDPERSRVVEVRIGQMAGGEALRELQEGIKARFMAFRNNVKDYVMEYGPMAFVHLYEGHAERTEDDPRAIGIREMLCAMRDDLNITTGVPNVWPTAKEAKQRVDHARNEIISHSTSRLIYLLLNRSFEDAANWVHAYNRWCSIRIIEALRHSLLGPDGILSKYFLKPASLLCKQLYAFGKVLTAMAEGYQVCGSALNSYDEFSRVSCGSTRVNIAALDQGVYHGLTQKASYAAANVSAMRVRNDLVNSFFNDPAKWMEFNDDSIMRRGSLTDPSSPVSARYEFDRCLRQNIPAVTFQVEELFQHANLGYQELAHNILGRLNIGSTLLFHGNVPGHTAQKAIVYPQNLSPAVRTAIEQAAWAMDPTIRFYASACADSIMMYQLAAPFELYRLADLKHWEDQYLAMKNHHGNGLHGRSPDLAINIDERGIPVYRERTSWFDYPAITYSPDHKAPDPVTGLISHEGQVRLEMDKVIMEARKKGIFYSRKTGNGWVIMRVWLDGSIDWSFDDALLMPEEETGLLPEGRDLLSAIIRQNRRELADVSRVVKLDFAGLMSREHPTEEQAWAYASRVLYAHRPMFIEIRNTLELTRPWYDSVYAFNFHIKKSWSPARMYRLIQAGILTQGENGLWVFRDEHGDQLAIANMNPIRLEILRVARPSEAAIVDAGLTLYHLFGKLMQCISDEELNEALDRALEILDDEDYCFGDEFMNINRLLSTALETELDIINSLGGDPGDPDHPGPEFIRNLAERGINQENQPGEILIFYNRIQLWHAL